METVRHLSDYLGIPRTKNKPKLSIEVLKRLHTARILFLSGFESEGFLIQTFLIEEILKGNPNLKGNTIQMYCDTKKNISWGESFCSDGLKYYYQIQVDTKYQHPYLEVYCIAIKYPNGDLYRGYIPDPTKDYSFVR
tara:strand:+ start:221 stop:631 length:411 start_codon:yes stop_codon:yes gene_type:complete